jgi:hypothetical protein
MVFRIAERLMRKSADSDTAPRRREEPSTPRSGLPSGNWKYKRQVSSDKTSNDAPNNPNLDGTP